MLTRGERQRRTSLWIESPLADAALALCWVPCALAAHLAEGDHGVLAVVFGIAMGLSIGHQPLTLPLTYASRWRFEANRRVFMWTPVVAIVVVVIATRVSLVLVAVVAGLWNAEHSLMQRYGIVRIYGRKSGDDQGRAERLMLFAWLGATLVWITAHGGVQRVVNQVDLGNVNSDTGSLLGHLAPEARIALVPVVALAALSTLRWLRAELRLRTGANPAKHAYLASTAALFVVAVFDPMAGLVGFVGSHAIEYFVVVNRSLRSEKRSDGPLGRALDRPHGDLWFYCAYAVAVGAVFGSLYRWAPGFVLTVVVVTLGAVHFFYDSFIWKLRRPAVAASLAATPARPPP